VVLGHVDAGKSTLMGRLLADLGVVTQKQVCCSAAGKKLCAYTRVHAGMLRSRPVAEILRQTARGQ
jgi:sulfate adenylyltransferase subunit 1 (EFTu-like GTPase family)